MAAGHSRPPAIDQLQPFCVRWTTQPEAGINFGFPRQPLQAALKRRLAGIEIRHCQVAVSPPAQN